MRKSKLVCGVGINDYDGYVNIDGKIIKSYCTWKDMLKRCYDPKVQLKQSTYIGCTVAPEWLLFSNFKMWFDINYKDGFHLVKDILVEGNKIYSPENCCFVKPSINGLLIDQYKKRGNYPLGVSVRKSGIYQAQCNNNKNKNLTKKFKTVEEAVAWYSETKTRIVLEVATRALEAGDISQQVFDALVARKF